MNELHGKCTIITGASTPTGIGLATARRFAAAGASILLVAEGTPEQLASAVREIRAVPGAGRVESLQIDLSAPGAPERMVQHADGLFGRVDVLMNNAAARANVPFGTYTREQFERCVAVNLAAPFFASQAVLPIMRRQGGGRIIHLASQLGHVTFESRALYGLTKAALIHLTKSMALELGKENIIVNAICPGPTDTGRRVANGPAVSQQLLDEIPLGRFGEPDEIANLAYYLAAQSPAFLQGQDIVIDGGYIVH